MLQTVLKGKHRAKPLKFGIYWNKTILEREVIFNDTCKYFLLGEDMADTNKLFGMGFLWGLHHTDSARFGWLYDSASDKIKLVAYSYVAKERIMKDICLAPFNTKITCKLSLENSKYCFTVYWNSSPLYIEKIPYSHKKKLAYYLQLYFGGNQTAPHDINVDIN